jgi:hypothetical protein
MILTATVPGLKEFMTSEGKHVKHKEEGYASDSSDRSGTPIQ